MKTNEINDRLLTTQEAAQVVSLTPGTLQNWRTTRRQRIPFLKCGRSVRYRHSDLLKWLDKQIVDRDVMEEA